ncbi:MAG TPA: hypothetical protein VNR68_07135 [Sphingomicrobium sp.]|nr:hypothetical protein [Sphingomicrobium sp.]
MRNEEQAYHRERAQQCRTMAEHSADPNIRRRHEELAAMHARQAGPELVEMAIEIGS